MSADVTSGKMADRVSQYRALCATAIVALVFGFLSFSFLLAPQLLLFPIVGLIFSISALRKISKRPMELTGKPFALVGLVLSAVLLVSGTSLHAVIYAIEVPKGYDRISFFDLQPDETSRLPIPDSALQLDGQRIFIKGYVYPGDMRHNLQTFVLVPDMGTCCFGGQPKLTDMIQITLKNPLRVDFSYRKRRLGGILHVDSRLKPISGLEGVYYQLDADYLN